ncbi:MAG: hypothetical protein WCO56_11770 [Verrucomicrobiota bacterium]
MKICRYYSWPPFLEIRKLFYVALLSFGSILCLAGCAANNITFVKDRGVYTTVAVEGHHLDMPGSGYVSCKIFGPNQTPAAVVVGYGYWAGGFNRPQAFILELVEASSGTVLGNMTGSSLAGKAAVFKLPIRKSGDYKLKLIINQSVYDTWDFSVNREMPADNVADILKPQVYAKGNLSVGIESSKGERDFAAYDSLLIHAMMEAVHKEAEKNNPDLFVQLPPGKVMIQCDLDEIGSVTSLKIISNTLNETLGQFYLRAVRNGAPYRPWPAAARASMGSQVRSLKVVFYYN